MKCSDQFNRRQSRANERLCLVLELRGQAREKSIQVFSAGKNKVVSIPRSLIQIHMTDAQYYCAVTVPRWLMHREGLYASTPATKPSPWPQRDERTIQEIKANGDAERAIFIAAYENRYRRMPGQSYDVSPRLTAAQGYANA